MSNKQPLVCPFKVLFSNDASNTLVCTSPYHQSGEKFEEALLNATVDETAGIGIDVHMLQPGLAVVPWWNSAQYPYAEHVRWYEKTYNCSVRDNPYVDYMLNGGDMVAAFVKRCRDKGLMPFISLRMNDSHGKEFVDSGEKGEIAVIPGFVLHCINRFYKEHPEYRLESKSDKAHWDTRVLNWAVPEVVDWMFGFIAEICTQYDIEGLELDFQRHCNYFRPKETTFDQRSKIMCDFIARVRGLLDKTAGNGRHRWLCARIPCYTEAFDVLGFDLEKMTASGLEMINVSPYYFTVQQTDLAKIRTLAPNAALYLELCHTIANERVTGGVPGYDDFLFRRTTPRQYYTAAHLAHARGGSGVSTFNFVYYRKHGTIGRGPFNEPPFEIFRNLDDYEWLAKQPQHYFLTTGWGDPFRKQRPLPRTLKQGQTATLAFDLAPPAGGWKNGGRLRIQATERFGDALWTAEINGVRLEETIDRSEPYPNPYPNLLGSLEEYRAWNVPAQLLRDGINDVKVTFEKGEPAFTIKYGDLALS